MKSIENILKEAEELPYSSVGKKITIEECVIIWKMMGRFIWEHLLRNQSILVPDIGRFTFIDVKIPIAHNPPRYLCKRIPEFIMSPKLANHFRIKCARTPVNSLQAQVSMNPSAIACLCNRDRSKVCALFKEILAYVYFKLAKNLPVKIPFYRIGELTIKGENYKMHFHRRFLENFEEMDIIKECWEI